MIHGLGERLQQQRLLKNLSQKAVADSLDISASVLSNFEKGERTPSLETLLSLARFYNCSTDYLLGFEKVENDKLLDVSMLNTNQYQLLQQLLNSLK